MPLLDHFRPPLDDRRSWQEFHGQWPAMIVLHLADRLPPGYEAGPTVQLGVNFEIDIGAFEQDMPDEERIGPPSSGTGTALEAPPMPSLSVETDLPMQDEFEVRIYDAKRGRRLVAVIEIVSPANKDRPERRRAFTAKCLTLLQQGVCVSIVDLVTIRDFNFYVELLDQIGTTDPTVNTETPALYAVTCQTRRNGKKPRLDTFHFPLALGKPLPKLPIWLTDELQLWLDLEATYRDTCRVLRIA